MGGSLGRAEGEIFLSADGALRGLNSVKNGLQELDRQSASFGGALRSNLQSMQSRMNEWGASLRSIGQGLTAGVTLPIAAAGGVVVNWAADLDESINKVSVLFGDAADEVLAFSQGSATNLGMAQQSALDFSSAFAGMLQPVAANSEELAGMSTEMTGLVADFASFHNLSPAEAFTVLQSAMAGETEAIRRYGVDVSAAAVEQQAMEMGLAATSAELTEQDKLLARYHLIMEQTTEEQDDFARTSDSVSNKLKIARARIQDVGVGFGRLLLPAVSKVLDVFEDLLDWIEDLDTGMKRWVLIIAGVAAALGPVLVAVGMLLPGLGALAGLVAALISPLGLVIAALGLLAFAFRDELKAALDWAVDTFGDLRESFTKFREMGVSPVQSALMALADVFPGLGQVIAPLRGLVENLGDAFNALKEGDYAGMFDALGAAASSVGSTILGAIRSIDWSGIASSLWGVITAAADWVGEQVLELPAIALDVFWKIAEGVQSAWDWVKGWIFGDGGGSGLAGDGTGGAAYGHAIPLGSVLLDIASWAEGEIPDAVDAILGWLGTITVSIADELWSIALGRPAIVVGFDIQHILQTVIGTIAYHTLKVVLRIPEVTVEDPIGTLGKAAAAIAGVISLRALATRVFPVLARISPVVAITVGAAWFTSTVFNAIKGYFEENPLKAIEVLAPIKAVMGDSPLQGIQNLSDAVQRRLQRWADDYDNPVDLVVDKVRTSLAAFPFSPQNMQTMSDAVLGKLQEWADGIEWPEISLPDIDISAPEINMPALNTWPGYADAIKTIDEARKMITDPIGWFKDQFGDDGESEKPETFPGTDIPVTGGGVSWGLPDFSAVANTGPFDDLIAKMGELVTEAASMVQSVASLMAGFANAVSANVTTATTSLDSMKAPISTVTTTLAAMVQAVAGLMAGFSNAVRANVTSASSTMTSQVSSMAGQVTSRFHALQSSVSASLGAMVSRASSAGSQMASALGSGANSAVSAVSGALSRIPGIIAGIGGAAESTAYSIGANIGNSFASGMRSALGAIQAAAAQMVAAADTALRARAQIASPSRLFSQLGEYVGEGFEQGIRHTYRDVARATAGLVNVPGISGVTGSVPAYAYATPHSAGPTYIHTTHVYAVRSDEWQGMVRQIQDMPGITIRQMEGEYDMMGPVRAGGGR